MIEVRNDRDLADFFKQKRAVIFYDAKWSEYATISKTMIEFVERYAKMGQRNVQFFCGEFEGDLVSLAARMVEVGVPDTVFLGNGSLSLFEVGKHLATINSVIGEGTQTVWLHIDRHFPSR